MVQNNQRQKNKTVKMIVIAAAAVLVVFAAVFVLRNYNKGKDTMMKAVYLMNEDGSNLFVDTEHGSPFYGTIPEDKIYDEKGKKIPAADLKNGDVVEIYGNGIMLESYPGQYPGITKLKRIESESKEYLDKYGDMLSQFTVKPDPSELPYLSLEYRQPEAQVTASVLTYGGYQWEYDNGNGEKASENADHVPFLKWDSYTDISLKEPAELKLVFNVQPKKVTVTRFSATAKGAEEETGKEVILEQSGDTELVVKGEAGYLYMVNAEWENGWAEYGFETTSP